MKIGVLIPTRGDRIKFLAHAKHLLSIQTLQPTEIEIVNDKALSDKCDVSYRYMLGIKRLFDKGCDLIVFWEDDDWYSKEYIRKMVQEWERANKPAIFGLHSTMYYHIGMRKHQKMEHRGRASAFSTLISKDVKITPTGGDNPFFDIHLWSKNESKKTVDFEKPICMGIKHGIGKSGGRGHLLSFPYKESDKDLKYLKSIVDDESFKFYSEYFEKAAV